MNSLTRGAQPGQSLQDLEFFGEKKIIRSLLGSDQSWKKTWEKGVLAKKKGGVKQIESLNTHLDHTPLPFFLARFVLHTLKNPRRKNWAAPAFFHRLSTLIRNLNATPISLLVRILTTYKFIFTSTYTGQHKVIKSFARWWIIFRELSWK